MDKTTKITMINGSSLEVHLHDDSNIIRGNGWYATDSLEEDFQRLDDSLKDLGKSDSAIEYAPHVRNYLDVVIDRLNKIKEKLDLECKSSDSYFE